MSDEEVVNGHVPSSPKLAQISAVPPIFVKLAVSKSHDLGHNVQVIVEDVNEAHDPEQTNRQGEFNQLLNQRM